MSNRTTAVKAATRDVIRESEPSEGSAPAAFLLSSDDNSSSDVRHPPIQQGGDGDAARLATKDRTIGSSHVIAVPPHRGAELLRQFELPILLVGALAPASGLWAIFGRQLANEPIIGTAAALVVSVTIVWYVLARLRDHANARPLSYVFPVNFFIFTAAFAAIALLRAPYSSAFFATGAACAIAGNFILAVYGRRLVKPHVVISGGRASEITIGGQYVSAPSLSDLEQLVATGWRAWAIVADLHYPHSERCERFFATAALAGVPVYHFRQIAESQSGQVKITHLSENDLGSLLPNVSYASVKRLIDIVACLLLIPVCIPLFFGIGLLIRLDSPGGAFFVQERMGFRGQTFRMFKFRTMRNRTMTNELDSQRNDAMTKTDDDRITKVGRFMRKTRMDELPQILNVLKGDMSLIGPRPEALSLSTWYDAELPFYSYRHIVRPGITGWAQVNQGHVTDVADVLGKLRFDFYYIKNISLWLDLLIALKTVRVIVGGIGAK